MGPMHEWDITRANNVFKGAKLKFCRLKYLNYCVEISVTLCVFYNMYIYQCKG